VWHQVHNIVSIDPRFIAEELMAPKFGLLSLSNKLSKIEIEVWKNKICKHLQRKHKKRDKM
jgi:hypothetical protein